MARKTKTTEFPEASEEATVVLQKKRVRRKYSLGDDYKAWKAHCDHLKSQATFHGSEARRYGTEYKKCFENGAEGFCNERDDQVWEESNNLLTLAELKADERANAWKTLPVDKLDLPRKLIAALKENGYTVLERVADWVDRENRDKIKGIGDKAVKDISHAVNKLTAPYHKEITKPEIEKAKAVVEELSQ